MKTTLNLIKANSPCIQGWQKLLNYLGKTQADHEILELTTILKSNGIQDAIWALCAVYDQEKNIRFMAAEFAETALIYNNDQRLILAIQAAKDYANSIISKESFAAASAAARAAASAADLDAARDAASAAASAAAWAAASAAASDAARAAARDAASAAASDAAWAAASAAAWAAASAAASDAARAAARDAAWEKFEQIFLKYN